MTTCNGSEASLALYVEGDLPPPEAGRLEDHLAECDSCRGFLRGLKATQDAVRALAAEPLPDEAFRAVRARVLAASSLPPSHRRIMPLWAWPAAAVLVAALALVSVRRERLASSHGPTEMAGLVSHPPASRATAAAAPGGSKPTLPPPARGSLAANAPPRGSTLRAGRHVSGTMKPPIVETSSDLTREEADQLARAVVALSGIDHVPDDLRGLGLGQEAEDSRGSLRSTGPAVRWTTADSSVVIYWQLDSNGGES